MLSVLASAIELMRNVYCSILYHNFYFSVMHRSLGYPTTRTCTTLLWSTARPRHVATIFIIIYLIKMLGYQTNGAGYSNICGLCLSVSPGNTSVVLRLIFILELNFLHNIVNKVNVNSIHFWLRQEPKVSSQDVCVCVHPSVCPCVCVTFFKREL